MSMVLAGDRRSYSPWDERPFTVLDDLLRHAAAQPQKIAIASYIGSSLDPVLIDYAKAAELVDKLAIKLFSLGVRPGDFVSYQFSNRWEFAIAHLATIRIGAVSNAIMPIYGKREIRFMIERTRSRVCMAFERTARGHPGEMFRELLTEVASLEHLILFDDNPGGSLEGQLASVEIDDAARERLDRLRPRPEHIETIMFSSGTTGEPKGVLHSFNSSYRAISGSFARTRMSSDDVVLMSSPLGHATGFWFGLLMPLICGCRAVYQDSWDPARSLRIIEKERVSWTMGSAAFVKDMCDAAEGIEFDHSSFRCFVSGGAPIPPKLVGRTSKLLGAKLIPCWGSTEIGMGTVGKLTDDEERRASSDGCPVEGVEVRVVDDHDVVLPANKPGHLQVKTVGQHVGYFQNEALYLASFDGDWFRTGDLGRLDEDGYVRIVGRSKDLVIRGGENIPIIEIENILLDHPDVSDVVIIGVPDERLGERCHAVIVPAAGAHPPRLEDLTGFLAQREVTRQYWPEFLSIAAQLPRTSSGKVQRFVIREKITLEGRL